jgi:hypothetical protein
VGEEPPDPDVPGPRLVPNAVTAAKFEEQLRRWHLNEATLARRGCLLLRTGQLNVEIGILQKVPIGGQALPVMTACVRIDYWNFDLWPPSVTFLDPVTREPAVPLVRALARVSPSEVRDVLIDHHPLTGRPFLCLPGVREYHSHPQHSGDDWLLHRHLREGDLVVLAERLWQRMARNVVGASVAVHSVATADPGSVANQLNLTLLQGDPELVRRTPPVESTDATHPAAPSPTALSEDAEGPLLTPTSPADGPSDPAMPIPTTLPPESSHHDRGPDAVPTP